MEKENEINQHQIFDNAFLSCCVWHKRLMIPLVNEIFNKNIPADAFIESETNEQYRKGSDSTGKEKLIKRITDALIRVGGGKYHLECESKNDGQILIRIAEYDMQIAFLDAVLENHTVRMRFPDTAVIFLRNHRNLPEEGDIIYSNETQSFEHKIPFVKVCNYTLQELVDKDLYLLFPFYLMRYEHAIKYTPNKHTTVESEAQNVYDNLVSAYNNGKILKTELENIMFLCRKVVSEMSRETDIQKKLEDIMGTDILKTPEELGYARGLEQGLAQGREQGLGQGEFIATLNNIKKFMSAYNISFDEVCKSLDILDKEKYRAHI